MSFINPQEKEISLKIVYYGPPFSGKTTNLQQILTKTGGEKKLVSLTEHQDRTLFYDFLPLSLGLVKGYKIRLHLYTVPGQPHLDTSRKLLLKGVDAVIFVADSQLQALESNRESWKNLQTNLRDHEIDFKTLPIVLQFNKRDLKGAVPISELLQLLDGRDSPTFEAVSLKGQGVMETLNAAVKLVLRGLK